MLKGTLINLRSAIDVANELQFFLKHTIRKSNDINFMKCVEPKCEFAYNIL